MEAARQWQFAPGGPAPETSGAWALWRLSLEFSA